MPYCLVSDLYAYGLPRGGIPNASRLINTVSATTDGLTLDEHGWVGDEPISFRADVGGSLPAPLVEGVLYYAIRVSDSVFQVAAAPAGAAINLTTVGDRVLVIESLPIAEAIAWAGEIINDNVPAHFVPFNPVPEIIRMTCAELAVAKLTARQSARPALISETVDGAQKRLARWATGVPVRGTTPDTRANTAVSASRAHRDPHGWNKCGAL